MANFFIRPLRQVSQALLANDSPRQIAWAAVIGMWLGMIPKGNLLAFLLGGLLLGLRVNKPGGLMAFSVFSFVGLWCDSLAHRLGSLILLWEPARPMHTWLYESSWSAWWGFNNTAVVGQLAVALYLTYPTYHLSLTLVTRFQEPLRRWLLRFKAVRWLRGAEIGTHWGTES